MSLSYAHGPVDVPLLGETIGENLRRTVERFGGREALVVSHSTLAPPTASSGWRSSRRARPHGPRRPQGRPGRDLGAEPLRVGRYAVRHRSHVAILVTVNPAYKAAELEHALGLAGVSLLVMARGFREVDYVGLLAKSPPRLRDTVALEDNWEAFLAEGEGVGLPSSPPARRPCSRGPDQHPVHVGDDRLAQGRDATHHNILNNAYFSARALGYNEHDRVCGRCRSTTGSAWSSAPSARATHGACMVIPGESFDAAAMLETVAAERCTALYGVPTMFIAGLEQPHFGRFDLSSLRTGMMGGAPCPVDLMKQVRARMHMEQVTIICGMTETSPVSTQTALDDPVDKRVETVGRVHPHLDQRVR